MKRSFIVAALAAVTMLTAGCGVAAEQATSNTLADTSAAAKFVDVGAETQVRVGTTSVREAGPANEAINFVATELYSQSSISGLELLGNGPVIATFVQPGCDFSLGQSELLVDAATGGVDVTFVFVHSGGDADAFMSFASEAGLAEENMLHVDDRNGVLSARFGVDAYPSTLLVDGAGRLSSSTGALDAVRLQRALSIVTSGE